MSGVERAGMIVGIAVAVGMEMATVEEASTGTETESTGTEVGTEVGTGTEVSIGAVVLNNVSVVSTLERIVSTDSWSVADEMSGWSGCVIAREDDEMEGLGSSDVTTVGSNGSTLKTSKDVLTISDREVKTAVGLD